MTIRKIVWGLLFAAICGMGCAAEVADGEWTVDVTPSKSNTLKGTTTAYPDVLTIKKGQLSSQVSGKQGFPAGTCTVKTEQGKTKLSADLVSPKHGTNHYEFELAASGLNGTLVWSKTGEDGKPKQAEFTLKSKAK